MICSSETSGFLRATLSNNQQYRTIPSEEFLVAWLVSQAILELWIARKVILLLTIIATLAFIDHVESCNAVFRFSCVHIQLFSNWRLIALNSNIYNLLWQ
jgi:hypothetical protein